MQDKDYESLKQENRLVVLPAAVGDKVYFLNGRFLLEGVITSYSVNEDGAWLMYFDIEEDDTVYSYNAETEKIGETIFLTKDEAERKILEKMERKK